MWRTALADAGVTVSVVDACHVRLAYRNQSQVVLVHELSVLTPSRVPNPPTEPGLLVAPRVTPECMNTAANQGWMVAADDGKYSVTVGGHTRQQLAPDSPQKQPHQHPGPPSWALLTVTRRLLALAPATGLELAAASHLSQSRVSRVLGKLAQHGLVEHDSDGYRPIDWRQLFDWWLLNYPGPGGTISYWASVDNIAAQTRQAVAALTAEGTRVAVSGDPAADLVAPWRVPTFATVYADHGTDLDKHGFIPVSNADEATLALCAPTDPGLWLPNPTRWMMNDLPLADPTQIVYDLAHGPEPDDRDEAADQLIEALQTRYHTHWANAAKKETNHD